MSKRYRQTLTGGLLVTALLLVGGLAACGGGAAAPLSREEDAFFAQAEEAVAAEPALAPEARSVAGGEPAFAQQSDIPQERLIIRTADLWLIVDDTLETLDAIGQMANAMGGFVVTSNSYRSDFESSYYGNITIRVPADRFDEALETLKQMAVEVTNETISGQDVTEEFVDLEARVRNLRAAEEQLQEIMDNAQDTEDVLAVYNQLVQIRGEIEVLEGRMQYLSESARLSTISVNLEPNIITQPVGVRWKPLETIKQSLEALGRTMADVVDFLIRFVIVVLPTLLVIGLVLGLALSPFYFVARGVLRRRRRLREARKLHEAQKEEENQEPD